MISSEESGSRAMPFAISMGRSRSTLRRHVSATCASFVIETFHHRRPAYCWWLLFNTRKPCNG
jgi:hypothetical protein